MQIIEILRHTTAAKEESKVLLFREGLFWRAYEYGALALCELIHPFKVTTRYYKGIGEWISYVGFPDASLKKWMEGRKISQDEENFVRFSLSAEEQKHINDVFEEWKSQHIAMAKTCVKPVAACEGENNSVVSPLSLLSSNEVEVIMRLRAFPLESSSPLDAMNFIAELKRLLQDNPK